MATILHLVRKHWSDESRERAGLDYVNRSSIVNCGGCVDEIWVTLRKERTEVIKPGNCNPEKVGKCSAEDDRIFQEIPGWK